MHHEADHFSFLDADADPGTTGLAMRIRIHIPNFVSIIAIRMNKKRPLDGVRWGPNQRGGYLTLAHMKRKWTPHTSTSLRGQIHPVLLVPRPEPTPDHTRTYTNQIPTLPYPGRRIAVPRRSSAGRGGLLSGRR